MKFISYPRTHRHSHGTLYQEVEVVCSSWVVLEFSSKNICTRVVKIFDLEHEVEVSEGVEDVLRAQLPRGARVDQRALAVQPRRVVLARSRLGEPGARK